MVMHTRWLESLPWCIELRQRCQECSPICILKDETDLIKEEVEPSKKKFESIPFGNVSYWYGVRWAKTMGKASYSAFLDSFDFW